MIHDNMGRWITDAELSQFSSLPTNERLKWIREELNKIYIGEYSVRMVAKNSGVISHRGLYNLEDKNDSSPRPSTLADIANFYQIPVSVLSATKPEKFFLGKQANEPKKGDIRTASYEVEIQFTLRNPENKEIQQEVITLKTRHLDADELLERIRTEVSIIEKRLERQRRMDEAYDILTKKAQSHD